MREQVQERAVTHPIGSAELEKFAPRVQVDLSSVDRYRRALETTLGIPFTSGNRIDVLKNGQEIFPAMLDAIEAAEHSIEFLTFVYWTGSIAERFANALAQKARAGVDVDVILDAYGAKRMNRALVRQMQSAGVNVQWFRPFRGWQVLRYNHRTHRKVLICDGRTAFTGGVGIADEWQGDARNPREWRDTHFRVHGPAVHGVSAAFIGNWAEMGNRIRLKEQEVPRLKAAGEAYVMPLRSVASVGWSDVATLFQVLAQLARSRLRVTTPYFVPDEDTAELLCEAARRGVQVEVLVPGPHIDTRVVRAAAQDGYGPMLRAGVRIHRYLPTLLHAKAITVDGVLACVGSANFNHRSLRQDDEFCLAVIDPKAVAVLDRHFDEDCRRAEALDAGAWQRRGLMQRAKEQLAQLVNDHL